MLNFRNMRTIVLMLLMVTIMPSFATTFYVATNGSNSSNGTTLTTPFLTIDYAIGKAAAGDIIYVRSGTYSYTSTITISKSGSSGKLITLSAYPADISSVFPVDGRPIINFSGMSLASTNQGFKLSNADYWYIYGIRIKGAGDNGMLVQNTDYTTIEFCDFLENRDAGFQIRSSSSHCTIKNCDSYFNADYVAGSTTSDGGNADGFAPKLDLGDSVVFISCRAWLNSDDGWDGYLKAFESSLPDLMTTYTINCWAWRNGYLKDGKTTTSGMNGNGIKMGGSTLKNQAHNWVATNCLSLYNKSKGFDQNNDAGSITLYNCSSFKNTANDYNLNSSGVTYNASSVFTVKNCVALGTTGTSFKSGTIQATNNFSTASTDYVSIDTTGISGHRKVDGSLPDVTFMHPKTGSAIIDAGTNVGLPYNGTKPDLGYWETGTIVNVLPTVSISAPANNASFNAPASITITATATDADGTISKVDFYNGTTLLNSDNASPYTYTWTAVAAGTYIIKAIATDNSGGSTTSSTITITVVNASLTQTIALKAGWNLISFNVSPTDKTVETIFKSVLTNVVEIKNADNFWRNGQNAIFNSVKTLNDGAAYLVNMKAAGSISLTGTALTPGVGTLKTGWQMVGCSYQLATPITTAFTTANLTTIKNLDIFWQTGGTGTLQNIEPGKGYFVKSK